MCGAQAGPHQWTPDQAFPRLHATTSDPAMSGLWWGHARSITSPRHLRGGPSASSMTASASDRKMVATFVIEARALALRLQEAISESLGLEQNQMQGQRTALLVSYCPPCPQLELTYRLPWHKDPIAVTLLLRDGIVELQVQRGGHWVTRNPVPNALVIDVGDQGLSHSSYSESVLHREIVISETERISVPTFSSPSPDAATSQADGSHKKQAILQSTSLNVLTDKGPVATPTADGTNIARSGPAHNTSEIPLIGGLAGLAPPASLSSSSLSHYSTTSLFGSNSDTATSSPGPVGARHSGSTTDPRPAAHVPPATTTTTTDASKLDLAIMACNIGLLVPVAPGVKELTISWKIGWKVIYGVLMVLSLVSTVTGFLTAWCPPVSWARRFSSSCARIGLINAAALFIIFIVCKLGRFGCAAGVASAPVVVLILIMVWIWSEWPTDGVEPAAEEGATTS